MEKELNCRKNLTLDIIDKEFEFFVDLSNFLNITVEDLLSSVIYSYYNDCLKSGAVNAFYTVLIKFNAKEKELN